MKCLIVDDSSTVRKIIHRMLSGHGFSCAEAENGAKALEVCTQVMPELIFLDWNMPVMNGIDFLKQLRAMKNGDYPRVIFCTTENDIDFVIKGIDAGANEYIMKPFDSDVIKTKLVQLGMIEERA